MINLIVEEYCDECPYFKPEVDKEDITCEALYWADRRVRSNTTITCQHASRCAVIKEYLNRTKENLNRTKEN